jgi:fumarylacetoacetase
MVMLNDWSARDIQAWESDPLGPFAAKNFATSISPWIVLMDALQPFRMESVGQDPEPLEYLQHEGKNTYDIRLSAAIKPKKQKETIVTKTNFNYLYWTMDQQLAHHTANGCNIRTGDLFGSGTISGPKESSYGSLLELSWKGTKPVKLKDGGERRFLKDGDTVILRGYCKNDAVRIGFGECRTRLKKAKYHTK